MMMSDGRPMSVSGVGTYYTIHRTGADFVVRCAAGPSTMIGSHATYAEAWDDIVNRAAAEMSAECGDSFADARAYVLEHPNGTMDGGYDLWQVGDDVLYEGSPGVVDEADDVWVTITTVDGGRVRCAQDYCGITEA